MAFGADICERSQRGYPDFSCGIVKGFMESPAKTDVRLVHLFMEGDILAESPADAIQVTTIENVSIGGNLYGNIIGNSQTGLGQPLTFDSQILIDGDIVEGGIYNNSGGFQSVRILGDLTGPGATGSEIWASGLMQDLQIDGAMFGRIGSNNQGFGGHPDVGQVTVGGDFVGFLPMTINSLETLEIGGDFDADVTISSAMGAGGFYRIAGEMVSGASLDVPSNGLGGQVVVNSDDTSALWSGDVVVGSTTLAPNYTTLSSELGGGQVGVAPFNFHQRTTAPGTGQTRDCDPYQGEAVMLPFDTGTNKNVPLADVRIRHYGPVFADGSGPHFRVEFKSDVLPSSWVDRTSLFQIDTDETAMSALTAHRDVVIEGTALNANGFTAAGRWRVRPLAGKVRSGDVAGNPDVAWDSNVESGDLGSGAGTKYDWYTFRVLLEAPEGGMLLDGGTSSSDLTSWGVAPYEVNADGETDSQDFDELAESYTGN